MPREQAFFDKQPQHIQDMVLRMSEDHTASDVIERLNTLDIYPTPDQLGHFRRKHNKSSGRHAVTSPGDTFDARVGQYIEGINQHRGDTWSNKNIGLSGAIWSRCAEKLCKAGMIAQVEGTRPMRYEQIVPDGDMDTWYSKEVV
jgi:hypothetical protein